MAVIIPNETQTGKHERRAEPKAHNRCAATRRSEDAESLGFHRGLSPALLEICALADVSKE